ncbi:hypothetical protein B0H19DRAFT_1374500 [Mycena capillaripes]|nr:hypothetical protein B0H19DRAFT_1374500 [Mycena capillaripes]
MPTAIAPINETRGRKSIHNGLFLLPFPRFQLRLSLPWIILAFATISSGLLVVLPLAAALPRPATTLLLFGRQLQRQDTCTDACTFTIPLPTPCRLADACTIDVANAVAGCDDCQVAAFGFDSPATLQDLQTYQTTCTAGGIPVTIVVNADVSTSVAVRGDLSVDAPPGQTEASNRSPGAPGTTGSGGADSTGSTPSGRSGETSSGENKPTTTPTGGSPAETNTSTSDSSPTSGGDAPIDTPKDGKPNGSKHLSSTLPLIGSILVALSAVIL